MPAESGASKNNRPHASRHTDDCFFMMKEDAFFFRDAGFSLFPPEKAYGEDSAKRGNSEHNADRQQHAVSTDA